MQGRGRFLAPFVMLVLAASAQAWIRPARADSAAAAYAAWMASPRPLESAPQGLEGEVLARCGAGDIGLTDAARSLLARKRSDAPLPDSDTLTRDLRASGEPHPWPRAWSFVARSLDRLTTMARLEAWLGPGSSPLRRCGVASGSTADGRLALVVVTVDALADLMPLPTAVRTGQWLTLEVRLRAQVSSATVVVAGTSGPARIVPSWIEGRTLRSRFSAEGPGELDVQAVADVDGGPRPVIEARLFVDTAPSRAPAERVAPGEPATDDGGGAAPGCAPAPDGRTNGPDVPDDERLARLIDLARASAALPPLMRDPRLDRLARAHSERMAQGRALAHDLGDGDAVDRARALGLDRHAMAENVANAETLPLAHRALWDSPAHRLNLLSRNYDAFGVGVAHDDRGQCWVTEVFASRR